MLHQLLTPMALMPAGKKPLGLKLTKHGLVQKLMMLILPVVIKLFWTPEKLFFLVEITDDKLYINYPGSCNNIYNFDCIEIFLDEDHSGGDHQYNYNAFAYHIAANGDACDNGTDRTWHLFKNDVESKFDTLSDHV